MSIFSKPACCNLSDADIGSLRTTLYYASQFKIHEKLIYLIGYYMTHRRIPKFYQVKTRPFLASLTIPNQSTFANGTVSTNFIIMRPLVIPLSWVFFISTFTLWEVSRCYYFLLHRFSFFFFLMFNHRIFILS